jgi:hypothetical protein
MAISWDTSACSVPLPLSDDEASRRDTLIFLAVRLEPGDLTADTLREWMVRVLLLQRLTGMRPPFGSDEELPNVLRRWCGLTTNAGFVPRAEWINSHIDGMTEFAEWRADVLIEEAAMFTPIGSAGEN